ncbi:receptor kinase-like protein Xa21 [Oryza glaberrima]|uniref:receptor kinase-like protein Xa21 n=1 Tax=Oryza glaberrima TaxID=4538 RepID=UPI00224C4FC4|nr:receptor kinase-like protein Xa21 [Oryza glaberrima]
MPSSSSKSRVHKPPGKRRQKRMPFCALRPSRGNTGHTCVKKPNKLATLILFALLLLCYGAGNVRCATVHENRVDLQALLDFKQGITSDPNGALSDWNTSIHFCRWTGVHCSQARPLRVTGLNLTSKGLSGQISSSLGNLTFLRNLVLSDNNLYGPIPLLNNLQHLEVLNLKENRLHGIIPDGLANCSNLTHLVISKNQLTGVIPPSIGNLSKLVLLTLFRNNLTGIIPQSLGSITPLKGLSLAENQLNGGIPDELWHLPNIEQLYLNENYLSGGIPETLPNISSLQELSLSTNMLGNTLPYNIGDALPSVYYLFMGNNMFQGNIPASLGNASALKQIDLPSNNLGGHIPSSLGKLSSMYYLNLEGNDLKADDSGGWEFLHALANCPLEQLSLSMNQLEGIIPNSVGNLSKSLTRLLLGGNELSGTVPLSIGELQNLTQLSLENNNLTGTIEEWIGKLTNLQRLNLEGNSFSGIIPPSISNLRQLTGLSLAKNKFTGFIPPSLGNLQNLLMVNLSYNNLQGSIPFQFGNLKQLIELQLSSNNFSGPIPETLDQCQHLQIIQIDQNILTGNITVTFKNLKGLGLLNLSHNNLSGPLPAYLDDLELTKLDLSFNNFQGVIPTTGVFSNATVVSLIGNPGLCGGTMDLHMPSCHTVSRRARRVNYLVKILIPIFGVMSLVLLAYFLLVEKRTSRSYFNFQPTFGEHFDKVTYKDLAQATRDFSEFNLIGKGSYGSVYKGKLKESKMEVAVKVFNLEMSGAERSFLSECEALRSIQHRNLLPIKTACSTVDNAGNVFKALVYEFMPNGNLDTWLHHRVDKEAPKHLGLTQRISIAVNVADALDYLHHDCGRPTVHCDLKPSNILLDDDMNALLGDFGIARFYANAQSTWAGSTSSVGLKGTIGYIPPEYGGGGHASTCGDVYSFGIVLLEILTCKRPTDPMFTDGLDIITFVHNSFPDQIYSVIDAHLLKECNNLAQEKMVPENEIYQLFVDLLQVALSCSRSLPSERLNMKQVASKIHAIKTSHQGWKCRKSTLEV